MKERLSKSTFIRRALEIHGNKYDYSLTVYIKAKEPVTIICPKHGEFKQRPLDHILKACGCPKCKGEKVAAILSYNKEKFIEIANDVHNFKYNYSLMNYVNYSTDIKIICPIHGEFWQNPRNHITGTGCPKCGREKANKSESYTLTDFIEKTNIIHFNKYNYNRVNYINSLTKVCIICPEHGEFWLTPANHLLGLGCPKCKLVGQTRLYNKLKEIFPDINIIFEADKTVIPWIDNLRIDIYIPSINLAIEYMGPLHYKEIPYFKNGSSLAKTQERDNRKRQKCLKNGCTLIEIQYYYTIQEFKNLITLITESLKILNNTIDNTGLLNNIS